MEFGLKGTSRLVTDVTGSRHSGLGFTVFWLFMAELSLATTVETRSSQTQNTSQSSLSDVVSAGKIL